MLTQSKVDSLRRVLQTSKADTSLVNLLLLLSNDFITKYEDQDAELDSAYVYLRRAERLSRSLPFVAGQVRSQCTLGRFLGVTGKTSEAEQQLQNVLSVYKKQGLKLQEASAWYYLGQVYARTQEGLLKKISCYNQAMILFQQLHLVAKEAYMLKTIADMHAAQGKQAVAQRELLQVLALYRSIHYDRLHYTYDLISSVYHSMSDYEEALKYSLAALESATLSRDTVDLGSFTWSLGILYDELKQWQPATVYYQKALTIFGQRSNYTVVHMIASSLCSDLSDHVSPQKALLFYQQINRKYPSVNETTRFIDYITLANCHLALKHFAIAEGYYVRMLAIGERSPVIDNVKISSHIKIGTFYVIVKQYDKARTHLSRALALLNQTGHSPGTMSVHLQLFKVDSAQGNYLSAIAHFQQYKALSDSIFNEKKSQQIASLQIKYDMRKKEQDISLLTRQNLMQQASIQQKNFQRNSILVGALLLAGLLGVSYNRYRLKQRSNQQLEIKQVEINQKNQFLEQILSDKDELLQEKEWMLKEIHHRVKNNLQVISSLLSAQSEFLHDPVALMAIQDSQNRVHAMSLIHQKLYQSDSLARVNMQVYIHDIVEYLIESFNRQTSVTDRLAISPIELDVTLATPLGLIINEAVTNSLKYAFPQNRPGNIAITLQLVNDQDYLLTIADDGIGLPAGLDVEQSNTMGLTMIRGLSGQLGGQLHINHHEGVQISIRFGLVKKATKAAWVSARSSTN